MEQPPTRNQANLKKKVPPLSKFDVGYLQTYDYVDKSLLLASLMAHKETYLFVPSMRRCGKTVTLKLLKAMAEGNRTALSGLKICMMWLKETNCFDVLKEYVTDLLNLRLPLEYLGLSRTTK